MNRELRHMACAGKTFFFASLWLPRIVREDAAVAYTFCRAVDDIADDPKGTERARLPELIRGIERRESGVPLVQGVLGLIERYPEVEEPLLELVRSCAQDGPGIAINSTEDLQRYCEGVAGTVGLLMYPILGGRDSRGRAYAQALGVAMQCTNIARDIWADVADGRVYLPRAWLGGGDLAQLLDGGATESRTVTTAVEQLLELAAERYTFGLSGLGYLSPECRRGIEIAARCYGAIGGRVLSHGALARSRATVPFFQKVGIAARVYLNASSSGRGELAFSE